MQQRRLLPHIWVGLLLFSPHIWWCPWQLGDLPQYVLMLGDISKFEYFPWVAGEMFSETYSRSRGNVSLAIYGLVVLARKLSFLRAPPAPYVFQKVLFFL